MNVALIYTRHSYPQISTIVILCGIFVAMVAQNGKGSQECFVSSTSDYTSAYSDMLEVVKKNLRYVYIHIYIYTEWKI